MPAILRLDELPDQLSEEEFRDLFGFVEHETLDFKRGVPPTRRGSSREPGTARPQNGDRAGAFDRPGSRNRRIMRVLKTMGLVEEYGEGVDRMIEAMEARLMEPPLFAATSSSVTVTLRNRFRVGVEDQVWLSLLGRQDLTVAERRILATVHREQSVTPRRLRTLLPEYDLKSTLRSAVAKGLLVRLGERGGSRYELSDEMVLRAGSRGIEAQSRRRQRLLDEMDSRGSLSSVEGAALLEESVPEVRQLLQDLMRAGLVRSTGRTRGTRYFRT